MTDRLQGIGDPRKPSPRFSSSYLAGGLVLGNAGAFRQSQIQRQWEISTLQMTNVPIIDQPRWPAMDAESAPAFMDFKLVFKAGDERVNYEDPSRQYRFEGVKAVAQLEATIRVPSIGFTFKTDPLDTSQCDFAVMGSEVNGQYYVS